MGALQRCHPRSPSSTMAESPPRGCRGGQTGWQLLGMDKHKHRMGRVVRWDGDAVLFKIGGMDMGWDCGIRALPKYNNCLKEQYVETTIFNQLLAKAKRLSQSKEVQKKQERLATWSAKNPNPSPIPSKPKLLVIPKKHKTSQIHQTCKPCQEEGGG